MAAKKAYRRGTKEKCLITKGTFSRLGGKKCGYPVTKMGKLSCKRVRNALARGSQYNDIPRLKKAGLCTYVRKCKIESRVC
jgi:hypothetical protein